ncbi:MAG: hypothetical protein AAB733_00535 [Patescibacteria group bacterium]
MTWDFQPDASGYRVREENNTLIAELGASATSYSESGFTENQKISRIVEYFSQFITTTIINTSFFTSVNPPRNAQEVMTILEQTATSIKIRVTPPPNPTGKAGVRVRFIPANARTAPHLQKPGGQFPSAYSAVYAADPPGTISVDFTDGLWEKTVIGLVPGVKYSVSVSYLNSDGVESPAGSSSMDLFAGFSDSELGIKVEKETFFVNEGVNFVVSSNQSGNGSIKIYGVNQNLVRIIRFAYSSGLTQVLWDGKDDNGEPVFTDVYWAVIESGEFGKKTVNVAAIR